MNADRLNDLSHRVIGCALVVSNALGVGYFEKVYENALALEIRGAGLRTQQQCPAMVWFRDMVVGEYFADILVEDELLVELKVASALVDIHRMQCTNYLKASGLRLALLLNFGTPRLGIKRVVNGL